MPMHSNRQPSSARHRQARRRSQGSRETQLLGTRFPRQPTDIQLIGQSPACINARRALNSGSRHVMNIKLSRRKLLRLAAGGAALPFAPRFAMAQRYPSPPLRVIVPFAPAAGADSVARLIAQWLSERLGQQFVIENRPGGATNIGTEAVVRAAADGYTLLVVDGSPAINATLFDKLNFNFIRDIAPVAS